MATAASTGLRDDPTHIAQLRSALWSAGYQTDKVSSLLGADRQHLQPDPAQSLLLNRQLPEGEALSTLIRLFILGLPASRDDAAKALAPLSLDSAEHVLHRLQLQDLAEATATLGFRPATPIAATPAARSDATA
jgi:hypothetical protein